MKIIISSDHAGYELKKYLTEHLAGSRLNIPKSLSVTLEVKDLGPVKYDANDSYVINSQKLANELKNETEAVAVMICGTGQGSAITLNRFKGVRAAVCVTQKMAKLAKAHNDANVLCLGARLIGKKKAIAIVRSFLRTRFEGGRHQSRVEMIDKN